jgi:hypothetical protein
MHDRTSKEATTSVPTSILFLFSFVYSLFLFSFPSVLLSYSEVKVLSGGQYEPRKCEAAART